MGTQLKLPVFGKVSLGPVAETVEALRAEPPVITSERASEPVPPEPTPSGSEDGFDALHDELEGLYLRLQRGMLYGPGFKKAWDKGRKDTCEAHGWSEADFYAELRRRMDARATGKIT